MPNPHPSSPWDDLSEKRLAELWMTGGKVVIAKTLSDEFQRYFSPHSIGGKARRLGLPKKAGGNPAAPPRIAGSSLAYQYAPRSAKRSAVEKGLQPVKFLPSVYVPPSKDQIAADEKLKAEWIASHGVKICEPAYFVPREHDFNRVARPMKGMG